MGSAAEIRKGRISAVKKKKKEKKHMLNIQNYTKRFGDKIAVDDLSLHIAAGEICAFIGHNGAGKTTTLKACCGLLKPDGGTITVNGIDIQKDPIACKKIMAYIPDNPDLYEFLTGYEYLNFVADMYGVSETDRKARLSTSRSSF